MRATGAGWLVLLFTVSVGQADETVINEQWAKEELSAAERDELVETSKKEPFHSIAPILVKKLHAGPPSFGIVLEGEKSWNNDGLDARGRAYLMARSVWLHHTYPGHDPAMGKVLLSLLRRATSDSEKHFLIRGIISQWTLDAEKPLADMVNDPKLPLSLRRLAVEALLERCDINVYMPLAVEIILEHEEGLPRRQAFNFTTNQGNRLFTLTQTNRHAVTALGFDLLAALPDKELQNGYFVARRLGYILKVANEFAPDQDDENYQDKSGLKDEFFIDTVKNALAWFSKNKNR